MRRFERAFADAQQAPEARAFWMGRVGLFATLRAIGVRRGDRVGICAYTCLGVVEAVTRLEAVPLFLDVDRHMNIAPAALRRLRTPPRALVLQHTFGVPCDLDASLEWARTCGVPVIEDCCHALGALWNGRRVGTFGLAAVFSFQWGKPFSTGQGGMMTFADAHLAREVDGIVASDGLVPPFRARASLAMQRGLHRYGVTPATQRLAKRVYRWACDRGLIAGSEPTSATLVGHADRFLMLASSGQAQAGLRQLRRWPDTLRRRLEAAGEIRRRLSDEGIPYAEPDPRATPMYLRCPVWVRDKRAALDAADREGLDVAGWYLSPAHPLPGGALTDLGYTAGLCPSAEEAFAHVITLPTLPALGPRGLDRALRILKQAV